MDQRLVQHLKPVAARFRCVRLWRSLAMIWSIAAAVGGLLLWLRAQGTWSISYAGLAVVAVAAGFVLLAIITSRVSFRSYRWIAQQVERNDASLQERLLTAIEQVPSAPDGQYGYLQSMVVDEALAHAHTHAWASTVPQNRIVRARWLNVPAFLFLLAVLAGLAFTQQPAHLGATTSDQPSPGHRAFGVAIEPGNAEIERGTNLIVLARFKDQVPGEARLVLAGDRDRRKIAMTRSLEDPLFAGYVPEVTQDLTYHVEYADEESEIYSVTVFEYPQLLRSDAKLAYPDYTQLPEKMVQDTRRVSAVEGSQLEWVCHLNKTVDSAQLIDQQGRSISLTPDSNIPNDYRASMSITESSRWTLKLVDREGRTNQNPSELIVKVLPNRPPEVKLALARDVKVSPLEELPVQASFRDDFGMPEFGLTYAIVGQPHQDVVLGEAVVRRERKEAHHIIDFEALAAEPDQLLSYHFWAEDHGPDGQRRRTYSDMFFAEVRHFEEIFRQGQQPAGGQQPANQSQQGSPNAQQAEQLAELQKQIINGTWKVIRRENLPRLSAAFQDDVTLLRDSQTAAIDQVQRLEEQIQDGQSHEFVDRVRNHMQDAVEQLTAAVADASVQTMHAALAAEQASYEALLKLRAREHEVVRSQQSQSRSRNSASSNASGSRSQQQLQELELDNDLNRYETERQARNQQQQEEDQQQRQLREVLNRLRDLARRQQDINKRLQQLQNALESAETEEQREEVRRQLKRLQDQQQEILRDTDELTDRMDQQNQESLENARQQLEQTREDVRRSAESLSRNDVPQALAEGTRAEREFERARDDVRKQTANEFSEEMREMRQEARQLDQQQQELGQRMADLETETGLRSDTRQNMSDDLRQQRQRLEKMLEDMQRTVRDAETSEPLLARNLYDSYREARQRRVADDLQTAEALLRSGLQPQARQPESSAREGIAQLRQGVEEAAESVLGNETEALRRAQTELEELARQLDEEMQRAETASRPAGERLDAGEGQRDPQTSPPGRQPVQPARAEEDGQGQTDQQPSPQTGPTDRPNQDPQGQPGGGSSDENSLRPNRQTNDQPPRTSSPATPGTSGERQPDAGGLEQFVNDSLGSAPLTGDDFGDWSDRLRDVEEMVEDPELRSEAARIRQRARTFRLDFTRKAQEPRWPLVRKLVAEPLHELQQRVTEELLRRSAERNALVPIDRDPVPDVYSEQVRRYYERLGSGD